MTFSPTDLSILIFIYISPFFPFFLHPKKEDVYCSVMQSRCASRGQMQAQAPRKTRQRTRPSLGVLPPPQHQHIRQLREGHVALSHACSASPTRPHPVQRAFSSFDTLVVYSSSLPSCEFEKGWFFFPYLLTRGLFCQPFYLSNS